MGLTRRSAAVSVLLAMEEHRKQAGLRLKRLREAKGWSQPDLYLKSGVSVKTISRFENGHHDGRRNTIRQLAKALGVNETDIVGDPPAPLGLGAREQQVDDGFAEFRVYVQELKDQISINERKLDSACNMISRLMEAVEGMTGALAYQAVQLKALSDDEARASRAQGREGSQGK